jgi:hypothetical protein
MPVSTPATGLFRGEETAGGEEEEAEAKEDERVEAILLMKGSRVKRMELLLARQ